MTTDADLEEACRRCEIRVVLTKGQHREVLANLSFSKQDGGRALQSDLPHLGLEKGDLLEPTPTLLDIGDAFDRLFLASEEPREVLFWRKRYQTKLVHRVPFFQLHWELVSPALQLMYFMLSTLESCKGFAWPFCGSASK